MVFLNGGFYKWAMMSVCISLRRRTDLGADVCATWADNLAMLRLYDLILWHLDEKDKFCLIQN